MLISQRKNKTGKRKIFMIKGDDIVTENTREKLEKLTDDMELYKEREFDFYSITPERVSSMVRDTLRYMIRLSEILLEEENNK